MSHETADMTVVKGGTKGLGQRVRRVHDTRDMREDNLAVGLPFLQSKVLYINVASARCRTACVHHKDSRSIILEESRRCKLWLSELEEDRSQVLGDFGGVDSCKKFGFSRTGGDS